MLILELILQLMCPRQGIIRKHVGNKRKRKRGGGILREDRNYTVGRNEMCSEEENKTCFRETE